MNILLGRVLALDYGTKRVGVAVSDPLQVIAQGITTLENDRDLFHNLKKLIVERAAARVVVGMPYSEDGGRGSKALEVERFIEELKKVVDVQIDTWDESLSSVTAHRVFVETGMKRKKRREKKRVDQMAAQLLLQEYLDAHQLEQKG